MTNEDRRAKPEDRSAFTPEVRERLHAQAFGHEKSWPIEYDLFADLRVALLKLDALAAEVAWLKAANAGHKESVDALEARVAELERDNDAFVKRSDECTRDLLKRAVQAEARVAVLAAECRAWRMYNRAPDTGAAVIVKETIAAVDAAGALEGGRS